MAAPLRRAIQRTRTWLLTQQQHDGSWVGELEGDTILESEFILLLAFLGQADTPQAVKAARHILEKQSPDGGWSLVPGGAMDISVSVKAYFALKLTGHDASAEYMHRARAVILAHGGADRVNSFTRFYLAMLGQISFDQCPSVPPELALLPKWFPVNLYAVSSWSRTIIVPLSIVSAHRPVTPTSARLGIRELFIQPPDEWPMTRAPGLSQMRSQLLWNRFFCAVDRLQKWLERHRLLPLRQRALDFCRRWMLERFADSDGLGAIFPPIIWSRIALRCLGYADDSPEARYCHDQLAGLMIEERDTLRLQPCLSPVWDTAITLRALLDSGLDADHPGIRRGAEWLLARQITASGDWSETVNSEAGGWCFEYNNRFYPDLDDTAMVTMALVERSGNIRAAGLPPAPHPPRLRIFDDGASAAPPVEPQRQVGHLAGSLIAISRAERWMLAMQNRDGGWGAFDRNNDRQFLCNVPFADHNAMIDPSSPDMTGRLLECLGRLGHRVGYPTVDRAVEYLRANQEPDGSWFGRWGVNYVYGTWMGLTGLTAVGVPDDDPAVAAGVNWLLSHQQPCGGWGETPDSYADPALRGQGPPTASQTAWAILGLLAAGQASHPTVARGIEFLIARQESDGTWHEPEFTGTGFPQVFYLRYHMYPVYFPLMALSRWARAVGTDWDQHAVAHVDEPVLAAA